MKRYLDHMQSRDPHERRSHALHVASVVTAVVFVVWITTLGTRLGGGGEVATDGGSDQAAALVEATPKVGPHLEVSTTSVYLPQYSQ